MAWYPISALNAEGQGRICTFLYTLMKETSLIFINQIVFEIKYKPEGEPDSSDDEEEKKQAEKKSEQAEA